MFSKARRSQIGWTEGLALAIGFVLVALLGAFHHAGLRALDRLSGPDRRDPHASILIVFAGLLFLHTAEIVAFAGVYRGLIGWGGLGTLRPSDDQSWEGLIYFSGINFTTLGYTSMKTEGPIRLISMMQALGGFMVLTWSATFIFSAWGRAFRQ